MNEHAPDLPAALEGLRLQLADTLDGLTAEEWDTPSLCDGWTIRHVVGHLTMPFRLGTGGIMLGLLRHGFRFDRFADRAARDADQISIDELVGCLRTHADDTWTPPGIGLIAPVVDTLVHGMDIRRPLGLPDVVDDAAVVAALEATVSLTMRPFVPRRRFAGLELVSREPVWTHGSGERCAGPGSSLLLTLWGRSSGLPELAGPGADLLAERLSAKVPTKPAG